MTTANNVTTETITVDQLTNDYALVTENGAIVLIEGDITESSAMPGVRRIETELGALYLDEEKEITVTEILYSDAKTVVNLLPQPRALVINGGLFPVELTGMDRDDKVGNIVRVTGSNYVIDLGLDDEVLYIA